MTRPLTFQQIEAFRAVVLLGTTVAAARMLHTTQPTVSRLLGQAQSATGLQLFVNDRGRLQLTREGRQLFETIQISYQGLERVEETVAALRESGAGVFRIACTPSLAQSVLPIAMERFARKYPQVRFNVQSVGSRQIEEGLRLGLHDIALTNKPYEGTEFNVKEVHRAQAVCVAAHGHPFAKLEEVCITDLRDQTLISLPHDDEVEIALREALLKEGISARRSIETIYSSNICTFAARGLGIGVINPYMASVFSDRLCIRKFVPALPVTSYVAFARFSTVSELSQHFLTALKGSFQVGQ
ncbi:LysR substrate-binding domain-containing protein [Cupriavidus taiwanensis]|uniref:LysR family transcriptional regulator n=1 Tax=Cupriavidus taiwanensis TaxID=164546 RepID=A0A7Z7JFE3_9BURK|nr:LysR substrate-binding domain-containing protein [Cupriavidus taiwanensis]SOZ17198.1 LysR family transcriptional regulator [Cupriavidus taiwanensis]SOZ96476.1 LysR family transcriptional regulator [Cupriavidus taiwanensis]SPC25581.1 LysR family transcriptional regulator [Cupriavidus taiwanensis]